ncbi:MAG: cysteine--tRNA ligase [Gammaproteobacteria bacterium GWE2_42_36]|nr:MAG: cysteine--tRNA ligase [Gammaproteobacteria bacterium GWE2_42_36]
MLKIYNSFTKMKEAFKPIIPHQVSMYVCGLTVYDHAHIGHARSFVAFDTIVRYLRYRGYRVKYVRNITDIDDKIIKRANENHEDFHALTERFIQSFHEDFEKLHLLVPDVEPRATQYMPQIIEMIEQLVKKGYAYQASNGDVYFDVMKFKSYGQLANRKLDELESGARIEITEAKKNPLDFTLWKLAKPNEPSWESSWGPGRPGWHIECSAMSLHTLGYPIDIHGGGHDLIFPHHENEIAQSEAAVGKRFVNYWMHAGHLQINKEKMSKSLGNFLTLKDMLKEHHPDAVRYFLISSYYRSPLNYDAKTLHAARQSVERLYIALRDVTPAEVIEAEMSTYEKRFIEAMNDDFNTPEALAVLFDIAKAINKSKIGNTAEAQSLAGLLKRLGGVLGILQDNPEVFLKGNSATVAIAVEEIERLIAARTDAKKNKNWIEADRIRKILACQLIELNDTPTDTTWSMGISNPILIAETIFAHLKGRRFIADYSTSALHKDADWNYRYVDVEGHSKIKQFSFSGEFMADFPGHVYSLPKLERLLDKIQDASSKLENIENGEMFIRVECFP